MITHPFTYQAPTTIEEAVKQLGQGDDAKVIAGGHSLLPLMKLGLAQPETLVDLRRIASLHEIRPMAPTCVPPAAATCPTDSAPESTPTPAPAAKTSRRSWPGPVSRPGPAASW